MLRKCPTALRGIIMLFLRLVAAGSIVCCSLICPGALADEASGTPAAMPVKADQPSKPKSESEVISEQFASQDNGTQQIALDRVKTLLSEPQKLDDDGRPIPTDFRVNYRWVMALAKSKRFDDAEN